MASKRVHYVGMQKLSAHEVRQVAVKAEADPRTVRAVLEGRAGRSLAASRVRKALGKLGYDAAPRPADVETPKPEACK